MKISNKISQKSIYGLFKGSMVVYILVTVMFLLFHKNEYLWWVGLFFISDISLFLYMEPDQIDVMVHEDGVEVNQKELFKKDIRRFNLNNKSISNIFIKNHLFGIKTILWFQLDGDFGRYYYINLSLFDNPSRDQIMNAFLQKLMNNNPNEEI
ncbi:hypothetical protein K4L44_12495 [Halosquirtibacter laminarini]|uniref:Uncharacterized protein n=1 Tax=Halosquirtibacter laminarini TaxID=3374600 RepID=A0AC61NN11_9BACT|nr:hypothetical protein K4L44_12495 [Prolixibacteraceae bacterium]